MFWAMALRHENYSWYLKLPNLRRSSKRPWVRDWQQRCIIATGDAWIKLQSFDLRFSTAFQLQTVLGALSRWIGNNPMHVLCAIITICRTVFYNRFSIKILNSACFPISAWTRIKMLMRHLVFMPLPRQLNKRTCWYEYFYFDLTTQL